MTKKPKTGRPPIPEAERRTSVLFLKLTKAERDLVDSVAVKPTVWARDVVLRAARRNLKGSK